MSPLRLVIFIAAIIAGSNASGFGHVVPAVKSFPVVRYAPFYNFPGLVRSIHAVAPAVAPAPILPAPLPARFLPAPVLPAPVAPAHLLPAPIPAPVQFAPAFSPPIAPAFGPPVAPAFAPPVPPVFGPAVGPAFAPAGSPAFAPVPYFAPALPKLAPALPVLPRLAPVVPGFSAPLYAQGVHGLPAAPFASAFPAPVLPPAPIAVTRAVPYGIAPYAPLPPAFKQFAWK